MPTARITELKPNGSFESQHGTMFSSIIYFDDNTWGSVNHKNASPPYNVGDEMEYSVQGNFHGTPKLKVQKPGFNSAPPARASAPPPVSRPSAPSPTLQTSPINGATVGMAMNLAMKTLTEQLSHDERVDRLCRPEFWLSVLETASDIIRVSRHIESGNLAPSVKDRANGVSSPVTPVRPPPRANTRPTQEQEQNIDLEAASQDVPF